MAETYAYPKNLNMIIGNCRFSYRQDHIQKLKSIKQVKTPAYITDSEIEEGGKNGVKEEVNIECRKLILRFIFHYFNPISHKSPFPFSCWE